MRRSGEQIFQTADVSSNRTCSKKLDSFRNSTSVSTSVLLPTLAPFAKSTPSTEKPDLHNSWNKVFSVQITFSFAPVVPALRPPWVQFMRVRLPSKTAVLLTLLEVQSVGGSCGVVTNFLSWSSCHKACKSRLSSIFWCSLMRWYTVWISHLGSGGYTIIRLLYHFCVLFLLVL